MSIQRDTRRYENWLRKQCDVVKHDLDRKHKRMTDSSFMFLRATYYRWARKIEEWCPELSDAPHVLAVGDVHTENFGIWRDKEGRLVWGINDFDEAAPMPYLFDLVRLATSARLAPGLPLTSVECSAATDQHSADIAAFLQDFYDGPEHATAKPTSRSTPPDVAELDQSWRRIDHDWLGVSADLAIQLDDRTNNSSVVLAFEFVDTKRVMLFVGDAQVGNWLSWQNLSWTVDGTTVTAPDLLARTVFYKVGHHGSHNATLKQHGLELMVSPDLCGFIPTNEQDAQKVKWGEMPFKPMLEDLDKRARHRVVRADDPWIAEATGKPDFVTPSGAIVGLSHDKDAGLWVELDIA